MTIATVDWDKAEWRPVRPGVDRKDFNGQGSSLALHRLQPDQVPRPHEHPQEQIVFVLQGEMEFYIAGENPIRVKSGGVISVPASVAHSARVIGDEVVLALDIFTPPRPD